MCIFTRYQHVCVKQAIWAFNNPVNDLDAMKSFRYLGFVYIGGKSLPNVFIEYQRKKFAVALVFAQCN